MNKKINILLGIMVIATLSILTKAQTLTGFPVTGVVVAGSVTAIKGAPYSAETASEMVKTLADGNRITNVFKQKVYRDSEGRVRTEQLPTNDLPAQYLIPFQHRNYALSLRKIVLQNPGKSLM